MFFGHIGMMFLMNKNEHIMNKNEHIMNKKLRKFSLVPKIRKTAKRFSHDGKTHLSEETTKLFSYNLLINRFNIIGSPQKGNQN